MTNNVLILTVGLPRSGKSTWAKGTGLPIVCPDSIRLALHGRRFIEEAEPYVWAIARTMVNALHLAGCDIVILDATSVTQKSRLAWVSDKWELRIQEFKTPMAECIVRAQKLEDWEIIPIIERMAAQFEPVNLAELGI